MIRTWILLLLLLSAVCPADEARALERLMNIVSALQVIGEEVVGEPVSGGSLLGDTVMLSLEVSGGFMYHVHIWSDSYFNIMEFWLEDPGGEVISIADGDHASLAAYPDSAGTWSLGILLHQGAYSDSAYYAAAVFRSEGYL